MTLPSAQFVFASAVTKLTRKHAATKTTTCHVPLCQPLSLHLRVSRYSYAPRTYQTVTSAGDVSTMR